MGNFRIGFPKDKKKEKSRTESHHLCVQQGGGTATHHPTMMHIVQYKADPNHWKHFHVSTKTVGSNPSVNNAVLNPKSLLTYIAIYITTTFILTIEQCTLTQRRKAAHMYTRVNTIRCILFRSRQIVTLNTSLITHELYVYVSAAMATHSVAGTCLDKCAKLHLIRKEEGRREKSLIVV